MFFVNFLIVGINDIAERILKAGSQDQLQKFLTDEGGLGELTRIESFNQGERQYLIREMQLALIAPNPNKNLILSEEPEIIEE